MPLGRARRRKLIGLGVSVLVLGLASIVVWHSLAPAPTAAKVGSFHLRSYCLPPDDLFAIVFSSQIPDRLYIGATHGAAAEKQLLRLDLDQASPNFNALAAPFIRKDFLPERGGTDRIHPPWAFFPSQEECDAFEKTIAGLDKTNPQKNLGEFCEVGEDGSVKLVGHGEQKVPADILRYWPLFGPDGHITLFIEPKSFADGHRSGVLLAQLGQSTPPRAVDSGAVGIPAEIFANGRLSRALVKDDGTVLVYDFGQGHMVAEPQLAMIGKALIDLTVPRHGLLTSVAIAADGFACYVMLEAPFPGYTAGLIDVNGKVSRLSVDNLLMLQEIYLPHQTSRQHADLLNAFKQRGRRKSPSIVNATTICLAASESKLALVDPVYQRIVTVSK